jgi:hypothetical protein
VRSRISVLTGLLAFLAACAFFAHGSNAQDKEKDKDVKEKKPMVGALPPHKLDKSFERANRPEDITNALLNDPLFQKAVQDAFKAGVDNQAARQKDPNLAGPTPAQAARQAFLRTLNDKEGTKKIDDKKFTDKKVDDKKFTDKKVDDKKFTDKKVEEKKDKKLEEKDKKAP